VVKVIYLRFVGHVD